MAAVTIRAAAEQLGVGYSTFKRWVHTGRVRTIQTEGGHHRVSDAELARLLAQKDRTLHARLKPRPTYKRDGTWGEASASRDETLLGLSARNRLHGFVDEVRVDGLLAQGRLRVGDQWLTAVITADAVKSLGLRRGDSAIAVIKSTEVMIGVVGPRAAV